MIKDVAIIFVFFFPFHVYSTELATFQENSLGAWEKLKQGSESIDKLLAGSSVIGGATVTNALGLMELQMYLKSVLSMDLDLNKTMHLPKIDNQAQKLAELVQEIKRDFDRKENDEVIMIKLNEAIDLIKIIFEMLKEAVQGAKKDRQLAAAEIVTDVAGIGAVAGGTIMVAKGVAVVGTSVVAVASAPVILTGVAVGAVGGAVAGGLFSIVRYFRQSNAIDTEAKPRRSGLEVDLGRIKSLALQLKINGGKQYENKIDQFLKDVEALKVETENFLKD